MTPSHRRSGLQPPRPLVHPHRGPLAAAKQPAAKQFAAKRPAPAQGSNGAHRGPVGRMQSALATALKADDDWKEF